MELGLSNKVAIVSGASAGMGRAIAKRLALEGACVVLAARREDRLIEVVEEIRHDGGTATYFVADMTKAQQIEDVVQFTVSYYGKPTIAVGNTEPTQSYGFAETSDEQFLQVFDELVLSFVRLARQVYGFMKEESWGRLVNIGSVCMKEPHRFYDLILSNTGRAAVLGLNKSLSNELAQYGITVNTIAPGLINTKPANILDAAATARGAKLVEPMPRIPLGSPGSPEDIANLCAFLCSAGAGYITGQVIAVDGGWTRSLL